MGPLELPPLRLREPIGVPRCAERRHDLGPDARLLQNLARGANFDRFARLDMPLGQVPTAVATNHQPLALRILDDAARGFDPDEILGETRKSGFGVGCQNRHGIVRSEKIHYLVTGNFAAIGGPEAKRPLAGKLPGENHRLVGEENGKVHNGCKDTQRNCHLQPGIRRWQRMMYNYTMGQGRFFAALGMTEKGLVRNGKGESSPGTARDFIQNNGNQR